MLNLQGKKNKTAQYAIGGVVGFIILVLLFSVPLMDRSSWNTAVPEGNPFSSKSVDLSSLSDGMSYESGAPGAPLSGELTYNPATSGDDIGSSLYNSGFDGISDGEIEEGEGESRAVAVSAGSSSKYSGSANAPSPRKVSIGKLNKVASIGSGGGSSGTRGKKQKFFGGGNDRAKFSENYNAPIGKIKKDSKLLSSANNSRKHSKKAEAINLKGKEEAGRSGIAAAFSNLVKADDSQITTGLEEAAAASGIAEGEIGGDLKKNDPGLNKSKYTPPAPGKPSSGDNSDEKYKQMLISLVMRGTLSPMFGAMGNVMSAAMMPTAAPKLGQDTSLDVKDKTTN